MKNCINCGKEFRNQYDLNRHVSKKVKCENEIEKNNTNQCEHCLQTFFNIYNKNKHYRSCKFKDDPIRALENELDIRPELPTCETECRFCHKVLSRASILHKHIFICKERIRYYEQLKKKTIIIPSGGCLIQNITNNNTINNNSININVFGKENLSHVEIERIIDEMRKINKTIEPSEDYLRAGKWVISFNCIVNENPENINNYLPDAKSMVTETLTEHGWVKQHTDDAVEQTFKVRSGQLVQIKDKIEDHNPKVFEASTTQRSWNHLEQFEKHGLGYNCQSSKNRRLRSAFKVSMLNRSEPEF